MLDLDKQTQLQSARFSPPDVAFHCRDYAKHLRAIAERLRMDIAEGEGAGAPVSVLPSDHVRIEELCLWECLEMGEIFDWDAVCEGLSDLDPGPSGPMKSHV